MPTQPRETELVDSEGNRLIVPPVRVEGNGPSLSKFAIPLLLYGRLNRAAINYTLLSVRDVATRLNCCTKTVYELVAAGEIPALKVLNTIRVHPAELDAFVKRRRQLKRRTRGRGLTEGRKAGGRGFRAENELVYNLPKIDAETPASPVLAAIDAPAVAQPASATSSAPVVEEKRAAPQDISRWTAGDWTSFISALPLVKSMPNDQRCSFFVVTDDQMPFATIETMRGSDRVFRLSIGVGRVMFDALCPAGRSNTPSEAPNTFAPDPRLARHAYVCIVCPADENAEQTKHLVREAHARQLVNKGYVRAPKMRDAGLPGDQKPQKRKRGPPPKPRHA